MLRHAHDCHACRDSCVAYQLSPMSWTQTLPRQPTPQPVGALVRADRNMLCRRPLVTGGCLVRSAVPKIRRTRNERETVVCAPDSSRVVRLTLSRVVRSASFRRSGITCRPASAHRPVASRSARPASTSSVPRWQRLASSSASSALRGWPSAARSSKTAQPRKGDPIQRPLRGSAGRVKQASPASSQRRLSRQGVSFSHD
jgi:hypothetical protein